MLILNLEFISDFVLYCMHKTFSVLPVDGNNKSQIANLKKYVDGKVATNISLECMLA